MTEFNRDSPMPISEEEVINLFKSMDGDNSGEVGNNNFVNQIEYEEFIAGFIE